MTEQRWRSATIREGVVRSTTRAFLYGLGQDDDDIARPHIGVIHTGGEMSPCNLALRDQALHAKSGVYAAGGDLSDVDIVDTYHLTGMELAHEATAEQLGTTAGTIYIR